MKPNTVVVAQVQVQGSCDEETIKIVVPNTAQTNGDTDNKIMRMSSIKDFAETKKLTDLQQSQMTIAIREDVLNRLGTSGTLGEHVCNNDFGRQSQNTDKGQEAGASEMLHKHSNIKTEVQTTKQVKIAQQKE